MSSEKFERLCSGQTVDGSPMATHCIDWDPDSDGQGATSGSLENGTSMPQRRDDGFETETHPVVRIRPRL